mgnify:CR=1 FL=1
MEAFLIMQASLVILIVMQVCKILLILVEPFAQQMILIYLGQHRLPVVQE